MDTISELDTVILYDGKRSFVALRMTGKGYAQNLPNPKNTFPPECPSSSPQGLFCGQASQNCIVCPVTMHHAVSIGLNAGKVNICFAL